MLCRSITHRHSANASVHAQGVAELCLLTDSCLAQEIGEGNVFLPLI